MQDATLPKFLTVKQVAESLNVTPQTVRTLIREGLLNSIRLGKEYRIYPDSVVQSFDRGFKKRKKFRKSAK